jgi:hypothetical protein
MERLTAGNYRLFLESYASIYDNGNDDLQEQENIQEFLQVVNELVEDGYDLSEYTYDELYEHYIEEGLAGRVVSAAKGALVKAAQKYGPRALETVKRGTKEVVKIPVQGTKNIVKGIIKPLQTKIGSVAATAAGLEAVLAGEKSLTRKALGKAGEGISMAGRAIYGGQPQTARPAPTPTPEDKKKSAWDQLQSVDLFDLVKGHLLDEGYAETEDAALAIMANMGEEWKQSIVEQDLTARQKYLMKKVSDMNAEKSGSAHTSVPGKQSTGGALDRANRSAMQMRGV